MEKIFKIFHYISFAQYPFMVIALFYFYEPIIIGFNDFGKDNLISNYNLGLLFIGIGLSFSSLADITKRTKLGDRVFGKQKNAKRWIIYLCIIVFSIFTMAFFAMFFTNNEKLKELSIGIFAFGIGTIGLLRMNLQIIKTYQKDWGQSPISTGFAKPDQNNQVG